MRQFSIQGIGVSEGYGFGKAHFIDDGTTHAPLYKITDPAKEYARFDKALNTTMGSLDKLKQAASSGLRGEAAEEIGYILEAHTQMLRSGRLIEGIKKRIKAKLVNAEAAVAYETARLARDFAKMADPYLAGRAKDITELGNRLIGGFSSILTKPPRRSILLAQSLDPASTALLDPAAVMGIAAGSGGSDSHTAIVARAMVMPAVLGIEGLGKINNGDEIILDGIEGKIIVHPTAATTRAYEARLKSFVRLQKRLEASSAKKAETADGERIGIYANIELPNEAKSLAGAEGVGLLRSEFLFMNRTDLPTEQEQYNFVEQVLKQVGNQPVVVRTLDIGGDKLAPALLGIANRGGLANRVVGNPALGLRAIRLSLKYPALFRVQISALLRVAALGDVRILLPMISSLDELKQAKQLIGSVYKRLKRKKLKAKMPPIGIMIETPSAALLADTFAEHCDFFAIGTNDLTMYTTAIDRDNEEVAPLYDPLHPAVLKMIQIVGQASWEHGIKVSICGEIAADTRCTALLIGLGMSEFSMAPSAIARVKHKIAHIDTVEARRMALKAVESGDSQEIRKLLSRNG